MTQNTPAATDDVDSSIDTKTADDAGDDVGADPPIEDAQDDDTTRTITLPLLTAYAAGALAAFNALGSLLYVHPSLILHATAFVTVVPIVRRRLERASGISLTRAVVVVIWLVATFVGNFWLIAAIL